MRFTTLLVAGFLVAAPVAAQDTQSSSKAQESPAKAKESAPKPSQEQKAADQPKTADQKSGSDLPVSLDKIRDGLDKPATVGEISGAVDKQPQPDFRVAIREKQKLEALIASLDFKGGPTPAGGVYAFEQQRLLFPSVDNPLAQPYAAFNQTQLTTILVENLVGKYLGDKSASAISKAQRDEAEAAARRQVEEAIAEYCASKPDNGAGIQLCIPTPSATTPAPPLP